MARMMSRDNKTVVFMQNIVKRKIFFLFSGIINFGGDTRKIIVYEQMRGIQIVYI